MRLMVGEANDSGHAGYALKGDRAINLTSEDETIGSDLGVLVRNASAVHDRVQALLANADDGEAAGGITPALPLQSSGKAICLGSNYVDHAREGGYDVPQYPALFMRGMTSMIPAGAAGLRIRSRLNGEIMQDGTTDDMIFPVDQTIAILSEVMTLEPGDIIAMGTPPGVGHARKPPVWMKAGDVVEIEAEGIGVLHNPIVDEAMS